MADPFTIAGAVSTGVGLLGKLFGGGADAERQQRYKKYLEMIRSLRDEDVRRTMKRTAGLTAQARQAAGARAASQGRSNEAESFILPAENNAIRAGSQEMEATLAPYRNAEMNAGQDFADRPIEADFGDWATTLGTTALKYGLDRERIGEMGKDVLGTKSGESATPSLDGITDTNSLDKQIQMRKKSRMRNYNQSDY